jgi:hypothetical protein
LTVNAVNHSQPTLPVNQLQIAVKNNVGVFFFQTTIPLHILLGENGLLPQDNFLKLWKEIQKDSVNSSVDRISYRNIDSIR